MARTVKNIVDTKTHLPTKFSTYMKVLFRKYQDRIGVYVTIW